jgi:hypothetical protein
MNLSQKPDKLSTWIKVGDAAAAVLRKRFGGGR